MKCKHLNGANHYLLRFFLVLVLVHLCNAGFSSFVYRAPDPAPVSHYAIRVSIHEYEGSLSGYQEITLENTSRISLETLALDWLVNETCDLEVHIQDRDFTVLYEDLTGTESICGLSAAQRRHHLRLFGYRGIPRSCGLVVIHLTEPILPGESLTITTKFSLHELFNPDAETMTLVNWHPKLWWDGQNTFDSYDVYVSDIEGYVLIASGLEKYENRRFVNDGARSFGLYLAKNKTVKRRQVDGVTIVSVFSEKGSEAGLICLETAVDVVRFYKDWFGFYPFEFLYIIPGEYSYPSGGYPVATGIVAIHGQENVHQRPKEFWKWITAHEIGHQFWGEYIMDADAPAWLWIGLGIYGDREYMLKKELPLDDVFRILSEYTRSVYFHDTSIDIPPHMVRGLPFDHNNVIVHGKGYAIISTLAYYLGKQRFDALLADAFEVYGKGEMGYRDFQHLIEHKTGENMSWFFEQWVRSGKFLACELNTIRTHEAEEGFINEVTVVCSGGIKMPVPVVAWFKDGSVQKQRTNRLLSHQNLSFYSRAPLTNVEIDPDNQLALIRPLPLLLDEDPEEFVQVLPWIGSGDHAMLILDSLLARENMGESLSWFAWFKLGILLFDGGYYKESLPAFKQSVQQSDVPDFMMASLVWKGHMHDLLGNRDQALEYYNRALGFPEHTKVTHSQYNIIINRTWILNRLDEPFFGK